MAWHWAGTDIGEAHHHTVVLDAEGEVLFSRKVIDDEPELQDLINDVLKLGDVIWAVDSPMAWPACSSTSCSTMVRRLSICPASQ